MEKIKVGVIFGGMSTEHSVSIVSGTSIIKNLNKEKYDVFPIDTWVKKIMKDKYGIEKERQIRKFAKDTYGMYSGIALQYLFNYSRNKKGV